MFLLSAQNKFYIMSSYAENHVKKNSSLNYVSSVGFQASKICMFFGKFTAEQVLKSFLGTNNSLKAPAFGFCDSLPFGLEESRELRALIDRFGSNTHSKMQKISAKNFFYTFELSLWIY